ncbi:phosphoethanolamine transferase [Eleftheria terrae]|uniref:phosphoethanolamine transferase n=1 Tax=Eleftheria terrae TaxID=1597781 RepID=UPI00263AE7FC|nr:phosphoethanolamine transferase [Eleftheria terrae]WKB51124.1 phosphoethanolamine transferase [Eleftheria terrae]
MQYPRPWAIGGAVILLIVILAPNIVLALGRIDTVEGLRQGLLPAIALLALLLSLSSRIWIGLMLLTPWALLAPLEAHYVFEYGQPTDAHIFGVVAETDLAEASAYLGGMTVMLLAIALTVCLVAAWTIRSFYRSATAWTGRTRYWLLASSIGTLIGTPVLTPQVEAADFASLTSTALWQEKDNFHGFDRYEPSYPLGVPVRWANYLQQKRILEDALQATASFRFGARQDASQAEARQIYILVIGETSRPDRWQLNGYERPTNPRLRGLADIVSFQDIVSPWAYTRMSVPIIVSRKPAASTNDRFVERSLVSAFKEAGFKTYWFSTQSPLGKHDSSIALHASEADEVRYLNPTSYGHAGVYDGALLVPLSETLNRNESKVLIVLHTLGSHFNYGDRYPGEFDHFKPSTKGMQNVSMRNGGLKRELNNSYDNSILYTDHLLAEVISQVERRHVRGGVLYVADHGENLFDGDCPRSGHGHHSVYDHRVAALWWNTPAYTQAFPEKAAQIRAHAAAPTSTSDIFHSLLDAAAITYPGENRSRSLFSAEWKFQPRWTQAQVNFDEAEIEPVCKMLKRPKKRPSGS